MNLKTVICIMIPLMFGTACADVKSAGRQIGHTTRDVSRDVGHATRDAAKTVGHTTRDAAKKVGSTVKKATSGDDSR